MSAQDKEKKSDSASEVSWGEEVYDGRLWRVLQSGLCCWKNHLLHLSQEDAGGREGEKR
jgi:hypothetical protein